MTAIMHYKNRFILLILLIMLFDISLMATGPRITHSLISPDKNEIFVIDLPPFISMESKGTGALNEIVAAVLTTANIDAVVTTLPLRSMVIYYLSQKKTVAIMGRHLGPDAETKKALIEIPLYVAEEKYLYYKPRHTDGLEYKGTLSNFKGLTYGASRGEDTKMYTQAGINVKKARILPLFKKLKNGTVDFISVPEQSARWFMEKYFAEYQSDFVMMKKSRGPVAISLYFNLNHPQGEESAESFKKGLCAIIDNGTYINILQKHLDDSFEVRSQLNRMRKFLK